MTWLHSLSILAIGDGSLMTWFEIVQVLGGGISMALGPIVVVLWRALEKERTYIRDSNKETTEVIANLTAVFDEKARESSTATRDIIEVVNRHHGQNTDSLASLMASIEKLAERINSRREN